MTSISHNNGNGQGELLGDDNAERAVLGACFLDAAVLDGLDLRSQDFRDERHGIIYRAMLDLRGEGVPVDYVTVSERLVRSGEYDRVADAIYLGGLLTATPTGVHAGAHAAIIKEWAYRRRLNDLAGEMAQKARDGSCEIEGWLERWANRLAQMPPSMQKAERVIHWAAEALEPQPPVDWLVYQLFSPGSVGVVVGEGGAGKTYSMLDMAVSVANREPWLNVPTKPSTVLLIDEESGERRLARRLGDVMRAHNAPADIPIAYTCLPRFDLTSPADALALKQMIGSTGAQLVIVDALADVMPGGDENLVKDVQPMMQRLREVADATESALIVIHHMNKIGGYRGSSAIQGAVDLMLTLARDDETGILTFTTTKTRDVAPFAFSALPNFGIDLFNLSPTATPEGKEHLTKSEDYVIRYLQAHGDAPMDDIKTHADACSPNAARQAVYRLVSRGKVGRIDTGGKGKSALYGIVRLQGEVVLSLT